jgi:cytoskeletal protein CcmA (bactofilin family)
MMNTSATVLQMKPNDNVMTGRMTVGVEESTTINFETEKITSVIAAGAEIVGNIVTKEGYKIDGTVVGDVTAMTVLVSEGALVKGTIRAQKVIVLGKVEGGIIANGYLVIAKTGEVSGDVQYREIVTYRGHILEGTIKRKT